MEAFSLLRYWRGAGSVGGSEAACTARTSCTTIVTSAACDDLTDSDTDNDEDDGPFFDLEFSVQDGGCREEEKGDEVFEVCDYGGGEFNFTLSSSSSSSASGHGLDGSSCDDDLFLKGHLIPLPPGSSTEPVNPDSKSHLPVAPTKSATKLRVFMLGLKKSKLEQQREIEKPEKSVEEVPIMSLFTRVHNSSKSQKKQSAEASPDETAGNSADRISFSKEAVQRYLRKVKPLYVRVSKRYGEKLKFSPTGQIGAARKSQGEKQKTPGDTAVGDGVKEQMSRQGDMLTGLREICKHLGKSRSASSAAAVTPSGFSSSRRDDSLQQQQDGIQSAILHCKRSFNASRG
ncbi:hypothetical protein SAY87_031955 [Trapa incisa]|uniref:Membrane-associated kinase regulator 2 n=1 Tax=Trapa incisa TaxID=236973 RepID=A0AAN7QNT9_9MYRT|nr:hypothetical protein SAY87_031955 [Trapa incisa]